MLTSNRELTPLFPHLIPKEKHTIETILQMFHERVEPMNDNIRERLEKYMQYIQDARKEQGDWFEWAVKGVAQVATKVTVEQRSIAYLLGIYKNWLTYGFGTYFSEQMKQLREIFTQRFGIEPTEAACRKLTTLVGDYGMVQAACSIMTVEPPTQDMSLLIATEAVKYATGHFKTIEGGRAGQ